MRAPFGTYLDGNLIDFHSVMGVSRLYCRAIAHFTRTGFEIRRVRIVDSTINDIDRFDRFHDKWV